MFRKTFSTVCGIAALAANMAIEVQGTLANFSKEVIVYSLDLGEDNEVPLLSTIDDMPRYFDSANRQEVEFPSDFSFPRSFQYDLTFGMVTRSHKQESIYEGSQSAIFDAANNRVRIERETKIF